MKKIMLLLLLIVGVLFQFCSSGKKAQVSVPKVTYTASVEPVITQHCSPCHIPPKGNKEALNTYDAAKAHVDESIVRMQRSPDEKGFMPFKHPKLPDSTVNVFVQWKADGLLEK